MLFSSALDVLRSTAKDLCALAGVCCTVFPHGIASQAGFIIGCALPGAPGSMHNTVGNVSWHVLLLLLQVVYEATENARLEFCKVSHMRHPSLWQWPCVVATASSAAGAASKGQRA
jgi:hypothetical protein